METDARALELDRARRSDREAFEEALGDVLASEPSERKPGGRESRIHLDHAVVLVSLAENQVDADHASKSGRGAHGRAGKTRGSLDQGRMKRRFAPPIREMARSEERRGGNEGGWRWGEGRVGGE